MGLDVPGQMSHANGSCSRCGENLVGDGFQVVLYCPNAEPEKVDLCEPDANPVLCDFKEECPPPQKPS